MTTSPRRRRLSWRIRVHLTFRSAVNCAPGRSSRHRRLAQGGRRRLRCSSLSDPTTIVVAEATDDADITVAPTERVLLGGKSGSGKSTLIRAIAGLWPWEE